MMTNDRLAATIGASAQTLPPLPFADTALDPVISAETLGFHHGKHHRTYVETLAKLVDGTPHADATLETIIMETNGDADSQAIFNNAAQIWNHNFYWHSLSPDAQTPSGDLAAAIVRDFGSVEAMQTEFAKVTIAQFGTGWGWLVSDAGTLKVVSTGDAEVPFTAGQIPLLTIDVWEHAYYLDWQNRRAGHVEAIIAKHLNWAKAAERFAKI
jgi:Fe-Mn family superoxide dismutase